MKIIASIITYNPDIERLEQNIESIKDQVNRIIIIDNGSAVIFNIQTLVNKFSNVDIIKNSSNLGIASALNQAAKYAYTNLYKWLLTLDQDSVASRNLIEIYRPLTEQKKVGIICCKIIDRNFREKREQNMKLSGWEEISMCITSASLMNLDAWKNVGGFREEMFIDSVDFDICLSMREHGYKLIRTYDTTLLHEVGHSEIKSLFGKEYQIYHHSPLRCYYMARNGIYLGILHNFFLRSMYRSFRFLYLTILFEDNKIEKVSMIIKGIWHALIRRYGKL